MNSDSSLWLMFGLGLVTGLAVGFIALCVMVMKRRAEAERHRRDMNDCLIGKMRDMGMSVLRAQAVGCWAGYKNIDE